MSEAVRRVKLKPRTFYESTSVQMVVCFEDAEDGTWALLPWEDYAMMQEILSKVTGEILAKRLKMQLQGDLKLVEEGNERDDT